MSISIDVSIACNVWQLNYYPQPAMLTLNLKHFRVVVSKIFYFHPYLGKIPNLTNIFQRG